MADKILLAINETALSISHVVVAIYMNDYSTDIGALQIC